MCAVFLPHWCGSTTRKGGHVAPERMGSDCDGWTDGDGRARVLPQHDSFASERRALYERPRLGYVAELQSTKGCRSR
jgi:hypothetical protein